MKPFDIFLIFTGLRISLSFAVYPEISHFHKQEARKSYHHKIELRGDIYFIRSFLNFGDVEKSKTFLFTNLIFIRAFEFAINILEFLAIDINILSASSFFSSDIFD